MDKPLFDAKSISSIAGRGKKNQQWLLDAVEAELHGTENAEGIHALIALGFTTKNLSSILSQANIHALNDKEKNTTGAIAALTSKSSITAFKKLIGTKEHPGIFTASNVSSILNGSGAHTEKAIAALTSEDSIAAFEKLIGTKEHPGIFTASNISSILHGAGANATAAIAVLMQYKDVFAAIVKEGTFTADSLSSILNGAGVDFGIGITAIKTRLPHLKELCTLFKPTQLATRLHSVPANKLITTIDGMYALYNSEIKGKTLLLPGALSKVLNASPAANKSIEHGGI